MKIKRLILLLIVILCSFCLCSCSAENNVKNSFGGRFKVVEELNDWTVIIYDTETKVQYLYYRKEHKVGITVLLDSDGKPLLYNEG